MNKPFIVGVAGCSGAGKTLFLQFLLEHFAQDEVCVISQDDYYKKRELQPVDKDGHVNFDLPDCIDHELLLEDLRSLQNGQIVIKQEYTFNVDAHKARVLTVYPAPIILLEGLFIFHYPEISGMLNVKIFIDAEEEVCLNRRLKRDIAQRGYSHEMIMYQWHNHVLPAYRSYLFPYKSNANEIIINNHHTNNELFNLSLKLGKELRNNVLYTD